MKKIGMTLLQQLSRSISGAMISFSLVGNRDLNVFYPIIPNSNQFHVSDIVWHEMQTSRICSEQFEILTKTIMQNLGVGESILLPQIAELFQFP
jgi:hypothetical protein